MFYMKELCMYDLSNEIANYTHDSVLFIPNWLLFVLLLNK